MLLVLATHEVLLNLHPMMFLLQMDAVAMTTGTIGVEGLKRISPEQLGVRCTANSYYKMSSFTLLLLKISFSFQLDYYLIVSYAF